MEQYERYASPVNPAIFPHLAAVLLTIGTFFTAWFFVFVVSRPKTQGKDSTFYKELFMSISASMFLGCGIVFLMLAVGLYI